MALVLVPQRERDRDREVGVLGKIMIISGNYLGRGAGTGARIFVDRGGGGA